MNKNNIIESMEFISEEDVLVVELDRRLSFTTVGTADKSCSNLFGIPCGCFGFQKPPPCNYASAVRG